MTDQAVRLRGSKNDFLIDFDHAGEDKKRDFLAKLTKVLRSSQEVRDFPELHFLLQLYLYRFYCYSSSSTVTSPTFSLA